MSRSKDKHQSHEDPDKVHKDLPAPKPVKPVEDSAAAPVAASSVVRVPAADPLAEQAATIAALQDQLLRLRADFDNFRKRTLREKTEIYDNAVFELMLDLLPVLDHLQLGIQAASAHRADKAIQDGLQLIFDQLIGVLAKFGLAPFDAEKQPFDPARFEAISTIPSDQAPEGAVMVQTRRGYTLRNKLLRPAQVVVSSGPAKDKAEAEQGPAASLSAAAESED